VNFTPFRIRLLLFFLLYGLAANVFSQQLYLQLNNDLNSRYAEAVYTQISHFHTAVKPYKIANIPHFQAYDSTLYYRTYSKTLHYLNNRKLIKYQTQKFELWANPIFSSIWGPIMGTSVKGTEDFQHRQFDVGFSLSANYKSKLSAQFNFFYSDNKFPAHIMRRIDSTQTIPHYGHFYSDINERYSFFSLSGYVSYKPSPYFSFQLGKDKNFWGDGYRSLFLSDNAGDYPFLKTTVEFWKIKYTILYARLLDEDVFSEKRDLLGKFGVFHFLSYNVTKRLNINAFESIVWAQVDSTGTRGFDFNYLNPAVFFRPVEFSIGSSDNALLGAGFRYQITKNKHLYGQVILDEFVLNEVFSRKGWWANKYGFQLGYMSFNTFNINNLFFRLEYNGVRPFTYSHSNALRNYGHLWQPLAHPQGANFEELIAIIRLNRGRWILKNKLINTWYGDDGENENYGGNIYKPYETHEFDYGNKTRQGIATQLFYSETTLSYTINPKYHFQFELGYVSRWQKTDLQTTQFNYAFVGFRTLFYNSSEY